jgi:hypothetical protein
MLGKRNVMTNGARNKSSVMSNVFLENRSASIPPNGAKRRKGSILKASTIPMAIPEPVN